MRYFVVVLACRFSPNCQKEKRKDTLFEPASALSLFPSLSLLLDDDLAMSAHIHRMHVCVCGKWPLVCFHLNYKAKCITCRCGKHENDSSDGGDCDVDGRNESPLELGVWVCRFPFCNNFLLLLLLVWCCLCCCIYFLLNRYKTKVRGMWHMKESNRGWLLKLLLLLFRSYFWNTSRIFFLLLRCCFVATLMNCSSSHGLCYKESPQQQLQQRQ